MRVIWLRGVSMHKPVPHVAATIAVAHRVSGDGSVVLLVMVLPVLPVMLRAAMLLSQNRSPNPTLKNHHQRKIRCKIR
jgi:hypothetical protein